MPSLLNKICAYPVGISWIIGACIINAVTLIKVGCIMFFNFTEFPYLTLTIVASTGLGFFLGMFTCWPWVRPICSKINGAPLKVGDYVQILSGTYKGTKAQVYEIVTGQGGWELVRLDLGSGASEKFNDIFETYAVFKIKT